jgi:lipopolysaccharide/colanic/teichoic acid biosynthesis glycosyltransferase
LKYYNEDALLDNQAFPLEYNDKILFPDKLRMNLEYYHHQSFHVDLKIILATFKLICNRSK